MRFNHHSTYLSNRFIDEAYHRRMLMRKEQDPEGYKVYGEGDWGEIGGVILHNYLMNDFPTEFECFDRMKLSQDFGFNHANCILRAGFKDGEIYICNEIYVFEKDTSEIIDIANEKSLEKNLYMYCDSAEPDRIKMWKKAGYKAIANNLPTSVDESNSDLTTENTTSQATETTNQVSSDANVQASDINNDSLNSNATTSENATTGSDVQATDVVSASTQQ